MRLERNLGVNQQAPGGIRDLSVVTALAVTGKLRQTGGRLAHRRFPENKADYAANSYKLSWILAEPPEHNW